MGMKTFYINIMMFKSLNLCHGSLRRKSVFGIQPQDVVCHILIVYDTVLAH